MKYYFTIGTVFKNESWGMREWIEHYKLHGVEHIVMVNDGSTDDYLPILQPYIDEGYVTLYQNELTQRVVGRQVDINNRYFIGKGHLDDTQWFAALDMDEYLYSPNHIDIKEVLKTKEEYASLEVNWAYFTSNGHLTQPENIVESFTQRVEYNASVYARAPNSDHPQNIGSHGPKTIVNTRFNVWGIGIHDSMVNGPKVNVSYMSRPESPELIINHYQLQSREYWEKVKMYRGDVNHWFRGNVRDFELFEAFDKIGIVEDNALKNMKRELEYGHKI